MYQDAYCRFEGIENKHIESLERMLKTHFSCANKWDKKQSLNLLPLTWLLSLTGELIVPLLIYWSRLKWSSQQRHCLSSQTDKSGNQAFRNERCCHMHQQILLIRFNRSFWNISGVFFFVFLICRSKAATAWERNPSPSSLMARERLVSVLNEKYKNTDLLHPL